MSKVLILGANGQLARNTTRFFLERIVKLALSPTMERRSLGVSRA